MCRFQHNEPVYRETGQPGGHAGPAGTAVTPHPRPFPGVAITEASGPSALHIQVCARNAFGENFSLVHPSNQHSLDVRIMSVEWILNWKDSPSPLNRLPESILFARSCAKTLKCPLSMQLSQRSYEVHPQLSTSLLKTLEHREVK